MPVAACKNFHQCLARRDEIFRRPPAFTWSEPCICCDVGFARKMSITKPEPDTHPVTGNRNKHRCVDCGEPIDKRNKGGQCKCCRSAIYGDNL